MIIDAVIDSTPATPENFGVELVAGQATLCWDPVVEGDIVGYNIYRTNKEGFLKLHHQVDKDTPFFSEPVSAGDFCNGCLSYAVSSFDRGGNNSIWTDPVTLYLTDY